MANVTLRQIRKSFGTVDIIKGIDLDIADGEFCVFVGPSGCGKSTLLRMVAGLEEVTSGKVEIGGHDVTGAAPADRGIAMVFQSYALYPHMTVAENIGFGLRMAKRPGSEIAARVKEASELLQLGHLLDRKPAQLSGGQRQRVAIGRAIVRHPEVFLFDEPLSNLDAALRVQMRTEISKLHNELGATMIYVTHDQVEAMTMADKIVVLQGGIIEQIGGPLELYHRPRNLFVAGFIGSPKMNFLKATAAPADDGDIRLTLSGGVQIDLGKPMRPVQAGEAVTLGIRPEHLQLPATSPMTIPGSIKLAEHLGSESLFYVGLADGSEISVKADGNAQGRPGDAIRFGLPANACHVFDTQGLALINGDLSK